MLFSLMDEGRLSPDDLALPYLDGAGEATKRRLKSVTLRQLLTHTSGIAAWYPFYADGRPFFTALEHVLATTPEEQGMVYSDLNFMLLGLIFQRVSGLSLREGLERYIRQGLGIREIAYGPVDPALCVPSCFGNQIEKEMCRERGMAFDGWREDGAAVRGECNDGNALLLLARRQRARRRVRHRGRFDKALPVLHEHRAPRLRARHGGRRLRPRPGL